MGETLLVYNGGYPGVERGRGMGLRAYSESGRRLSSAVPGEWVWTTQVAGGFAYAISARGASVIDLRSGDVVSRAATAPAGLEMLSPRTP